MTKKEKILEWVVPVICVTLALLVGTINGIQIGREQVRYRERIYTITKIKTVTKGGETKTDTTWNWIKPEEIDTILNH